MGGNSKINFYGGFTTMTIASGGFDVLGSASNNGNIITGFNCLAAGAGNGINAFNSYGTRAINCNVKCTGAGNGYYFAAGAEECLNCIGESVSGVGIAGANQVNNCRGISTSSNGISAVVVSNSVGISTSSYGIYATTAVNSRAYSSSGSAIYGNTNNCYAESATGKSGVNPNPGINSTYVANANANFTDYVVNLKNCVVINKWNNAGGHNLNAGNAPSAAINCYLEVANASAFNVKSQWGISYKLANNVYSGTSTPVGAGATNVVTNTPDSQGNIIV